jgi:dihydrolipoamide dehydrogenase
VSSHYEVVVLGAGPGGYVAAIRAAQLGKSVAVIEKQYWGGVCLNVGCIPSKALLRNAELAHVFRHQAEQFGISGDVTFDYGAAVDRSRKVADGRARGVHYLMRKNAITEIDGHGTFIDAHSIQVTLASGEQQILTFDNAIIATGSTVSLLPGVEISNNVVTYETQILARELPSSIVIVGAGAIGVEFAYILANYGVSVTLIEYLDRPLPNEDAEISREIVRQYKNLGIDILTSTKVESIEDYGSSVAVTYTASNGEQSTISTEKVLMSVGFAPRTAGYGLENTGVALTDRGAIAIDDYMRTSVPHLYAIGDVTAKLQLAHVAEAQAMVAAETLAGVDTLPLDYRMTPRATFGQPQVASFGLTEQQAVEEGYDIKVAKFPFTANGKAQGQGDPSGFIKLIGNAKDDTLLGGHLIGHDVAELLPELTLAQKWGLTAAQLSRNVHSHPTLGEALQEGFHGLCGHMINL